RRASAGRQGQETPAAAGGRRLPVYIGLVSAGGAMLVLLGALTLVQDDLTPAGWASLAALLVAAVFVEAFPVPIKGVRAGGMSLAAVFIVATGCIYGWGAAAMLGAVTRGSVELVQRRPWMKVAYNASVYAIAGACAGVIASYGADHTDHVAWFSTQVIASAATFYVLNVVLVALVVSISTGKSLGVVVAQTVESTVVAFATMASVAMMLCVMWDRSPLLAATLVGPFIAISLYQRSVLRELDAIELALTDPITGLGNHRHFQRELERQLDEVDETGVPLALCLFDVDEFKWINDSHGHPVGDEILALVGGHLRDAGEAFRLGGDEFAVLLRTVTEAEAVEIASQAVSRVARARPGEDFAIAVSAGLATYPAEGLERADLVRAADSALYLAKAEGRAAVRLYRPGTIDRSARRGSAEIDRRARLRAAATLAGAIDVRDAYTGSHSQAVGELAARLGEQLELPAETVELLRIAG
ncbi:MAG TPA: diguanylate cyclase, partial [Caldimonas sp.]|nr:diguanylate cyclase [Caldimonas sp.]